MMNGLVSSSHAVSQLTYHLEWCPKYRRNIFRKEENRQLCELLIREVAARHLIEIVELFVMPDHVHAVVRLPISMSPGKACQLLKGGTSYLLQRVKPNYRKAYPRGHLWSPGKFVRCVGDADFETTCRYVRNQRDVHQRTLVAYA